MNEYDHPHPDKRYIMVIYRRHILQMKKKYGTARCLCHYLGYIHSYLGCKRQVIENARK